MNVRFHETGKFVRVWKAVGSGFRNPQIYRRGGAFQGFPWCKSPRRADSLRDEQYVVFFADRLSYRFVNKLDVLEYSHRYRHSEEEGLEDSTIRREPSCTQRIDNRWQTSIFSVILIRHSNFQLISLTFTKSGSLCRMQSEGFLLA